MLTYQELYEFLRKEKYGEMLQQLPKDFVEQVAEYLHGKKENEPEENSDGLFQDQMLQSRKQLENSFAIFKEIILRRKKKILHLVFVAAETGIMKRDYENMLSFEKDMFDKLVKAVEEADKELSNSLHGKINKEKGNFRLVMFNQDVEQFVDMNGNDVGPFSGGELVNIENEVANILVGGGKASFVDEE